jgi:hypothetical protein
MSRLTTVAMLGCLPLIAAGCASAPASDSTTPVAFYNAYRTGSEALPDAIVGCEALGSVSASVPEPEGGGTGYFDPRPLLETLAGRARRKGADTAVVLLPTGQLQRESRSLRATIFRCAGGAVPESVGSRIE